MTTSNIIQTTRFGEVPVGPEHLIEFRDGMIGFPHLKQYVLIESQSMPLILWLQSTENPAVAFPVVEPWFFQKDYRPQANEAEKLAIQMSEGDRSKLFVVLTIPSEMSRMTVNMKAPVLINLDKGHGVQLVLAERGYEVRVSAYETFSRALATYQLTQSADHLDPAPSARPSTHQAESWAVIQVRGGGSDLRI